VLSFSLARPGLSSRTGQQWPRWREADFSSRTFFSGCGVRA